MLEFTGERIVPESSHCEHTFALKMYQEHLARYLFASQVCANKRVLDIGCGVGYGSQLLARSGAAEVVAFDASEAAISHAKQFYRHHAVQYTVALAEAFSFSDKFDVVTCFELIEHVDDQHLILERISAAMAEDGLLFMSTPRKVSQPRSAFHKHELALFEFLGLLDCYFPSVHLHVENNHFASLVTNGSPSELDRIRTIHSQFDPGQADYFLAVASRRPFDALRPQLVLNDDAYVLNLERDVKILHNAEDSLRQENQRLTNENKTLELQVQRDTTSKLHLEEDLSASLRELATLRDDTVKLRTSEQQARLELAMSLSEAETNRVRTQELMEQIGRTTSELDRVKKDLQATREEAKSARLSADSAEEVKLALQHELDQFQHAAAIQRSQAERDSAILRELKQRCEELEVHSALVESDAASAHARLEQAARDCQQTLRHCEHERDQWRKEAQQFRDRMALVKMDAENDDYRSRERHRQIHELQEAVKALEISLHEAQQQKLERQLELDRTRAEADLLRNETEALRTAQAEVDREHSENKALRHRVNELQSELDTTATALNRLSAQVAQFTQDFTVLRHERRDAGLRISDLEKQVIDLRSSWSWRITKPARRLVDTYYLLRPPQKKNTQPIRVTAPETSITRGEPEAVLPAFPPTLKTDLFSGKRQFDIVYVIGCHEGESKRYRVHNLVESLATLGYSAIALLDADIPALVEAEVICRRLVLFRCAWDDRIESAMDYCRQRNIPTVFDIDDLVFDPEQIDFVRVLSTFSENDREDYLRGVQRYRKTLMNCSYATCTTTYLAKLIEETGKTARVIPNALNRQQLELAKTIARRPADGLFRIGYFSGSNTHQVDFQDCESALLRVMSTYPEVQLVIGGILDLGPKWAAYRERVERLPFMPYTEMLGALASVDANLAPLELGNPYCEGKSQLKVFEAGLVGVPTIATAISSYSEAIDHGRDGMLVRNSQEWLDALRTLISSDEKRREMGRLAQERAVQQFSPHRVAGIAAEVYGLQAEPTVTRKESASIPAPVPTEKLGISWLVPGLIIGGGGHRNILRAAYHLHRFGHHIELYFTSTDQTEKQLRSAVVEHFYPLDCPMFRYEGTIGKSDVIFATHWSTVDAAVRNRASAKELMYFVQDFEPAFAPMGTEYILAENTYRMGLYHITSGPWCEDFLRKQFKVPADHFLFPVDTGVYYPRASNRQEKRILFFAKPEMPRRCYELGLMALEELQRLKPGYEIVLFGSPNVDPSRVPFRCKTRGILPTVQDLAELYSSAEIGIVFSTTNPSLVPYEMMACGLPVVDLGRPGNEINYSGRNDIAFLANPQPQVMAAQISALLDNLSERNRRSANGLRFVQSFPSEEQMARRVETLIIERLKTLGLLHSTTAG